MNKSAVKNYAVEARKKWIQAIAQQAAFYGCTEKGSLSEADITKQLADKGVFLTANEKSARSALVNDINEKGYQNAIEEIAYTWFNRLIAIRFMEVNGYLPSGIRVLSSIDADRIEPDCVREYARLDFLNQDTAAKLAAESDEKLYRYILVEQCNALGKIMPKMFTHIGGIAALLLPERLYIKDGLVHDLTHIKDIEEKDFGEQIETIGWLYQYYISEKKDEVFAALKKNVKITRENIPAATQLFTPEWIVKYMVENSLGRLWLEHLAANGEGFYFNFNDDGSNAASSVVTVDSVKNLKANWKYYLNEAKQEPDVQAQLEKIRAEHKTMRPVDIKIIDPCMGSGHILVYAFDVLYQIYLSQGYSEREIPDLILENNIYGLDIDERACQLAYFALMMKARSYNRRFFRREEGKAVPQPQVYSPQADAELLEYGSLYKIDTLDPMPEQVVGQITLDDMKYEDKLNDWNFRRLLHQKYDVVVTNPPYMGSSGMGGKLSEYVKKNYPDSKSDMFAVFIEKCGGMLNQNGLQAMITQHAWMFLSSYEKLRAKLMRRSIINMAHLGARAFEEIGGEVVQTTAFVVANKHIADYEAIYVRLVDFIGQQTKEDAFLSGNSRHTAKQENFEKIPGGPVAYWVSETVLSVYDKAKTLGSIASPKTGMTTGDNDRFLRLWHEINIEDANFYAKSADDAKLSGCKWFTYSKGGGFRRWYGYFEYLVNWANNGHEIKNNTKSNGLKAASVRSESLYFKPLISWSAVTSAQFSCRFVNGGSLFDSGGSSIFVTENKFYILSVLNSKIGQYFLNINNATLNYQPGDIASVPIMTNSEMAPVIENLTEENIALSRSDWDSFETSWDFQTHPLIKFRMAGASAWGDAKPTSRISSAFKAWEMLADGQVEKLKANEEELNRIFIDIYGLQDELTPEVEDKDVTVCRADLGREIRSFISYAVGCIFGRYSLDVPGLAYAGGDWDSGKYQSYIPEDDNILPITDADYFGDDIVMRFVDFVKVVYGEETLAENLEFIARALYPNGNGTAREMIRRYFQNDFFKDHCKIYQKRPIYWLFDSGKQNGFKALIYLHRYDKYTVARVRTEYLHPLQRKYEAEIQRMDKLADLPETSARDKAEFRKQTEKIEKQIAECRAYDQIISHIAAQTIELDLDDGVKVNYEKFQGVEVPRDDGKGTIKMDLLGKI